ncbi:MAG: DUF6807 family protein [Cyclobacteriaceae bacterium]
MKFHLLILIQILPWLVYSQTIATDFQDEGVMFSEKGRQVLFYRTSSDPSQGEYQRPHYIHPLYSLDGEIMTEDYPEDHLHHHGIFWAWHQLYIGEKRIGDGWENRDFNWTVLSVEEEKIDGPAKRIVSKVNWTSPLWTDGTGVEVPFVSESTKITVHPQDKAYRLIDIEISILALEPKVSMGGSEDAKGYGA